MAPVRIGGQKLIKTCPPLRLAFRKNRLRKAARKHVTAETRTVNESLGSGADRLQAPKPKLQGSGKFRCVRLIVFRSLREEQARLQIRKPSGHDKIIRGKFHAQGAGGGNKFKILFRECKNRDLAHIHLLAARKVKEQIERALKSLDIDHEGGFPLRVCRDVCGRQIQRLTPLSAVCASSPWWRNGAKV